MKNKVVKKIILSIFLFIILLNNIAYGFDVTEITGTKIEIEAEKAFANTIITVLSTIGSIISVIVLVIIGIKYMIGSTEERASYKKSLMPYIIGCVLIFLASTIAGIVYNISQSLIK